jgi:hypothetical protein
MTYWIMRGVRVSDFSELLERTHDHYTIAYVSEKGAKLDVTNQKEHH